MHPLIALGAPTAVLVRVALSLPLSLPLPLLLPLLQFK